MCADTSSPLDLGEQVLRQILHGTPAGVGILDARLRYLYVNPAFARMNGLPAADHIGRTVAEVLPGTDGREDVLRAVLADGRPREVTLTSTGRAKVVSDLEIRRRHGAYHRLLDHDGRVLGLVGIVLEVGAACLRQHELERSRRRLALLETATVRIGTTLDMDTTCRELADFLVPALADAATVEVLPAGRAGVRPPPSGVLRLHRAATAAVPRLRRHVRAVGASGEYVDHREGSAVSCCLESGRPLAGNLLTDGWPGPPGPDGEQAAACRAAGIHSTLVVPLAARGRSLGAVSMVRAGNSPSFSREDVEDVRDLAGRAAVSLDNALRYTRERDIAVELQRALLAEPSAPEPSAPEPEVEVEVATRYLPAGSSAMVGGDWFDTVRQSDGRTLLVMGDVMGHGVAAAVDMSHYRAILRVVAADGLAPHRVLDRLDALVSSSSSVRPATCVLALADPARGSCRYASAGHLPPAVLLPGGRVRLLPVPPGPPLGTGFGGYEPVSGPCGPGWVLLLYTDGLIERRGEDIDVSLGRLTGLRLDAAAGLDELLDEILARLYTSSVLAEDDVAVLAARVRA